MKVCMFAPALSLWSFGGVAEHTYQLSKQLSRLGCEVHVLCKIVKGRSAFEVVDGIHIHRLVPNKGPTWFFSVKKSMFADFSNQWKFDLFHSQGPCGALMRINRPLVVTLHGSSANEAKEVFRDFVDMPRLAIWNFRAYVFHALAVPSTYLPTFFLKRVTRGATKIIAVSRFVKEEAQRIFRAPSKKIEVVYNGAQRKPTALFAENKEGPIILHVGHLGVRKGLPYLICALRLVFEENQHVRAVIIGDGPLRSLCQHMARKLNISHRITFTGIVTEKEKECWYQKADLCVFPSTYDPFPIVALEALAAGKPVVASNVGGLPEVIQNNINGLLVPPRNPKEIAQAVGTILSDDKLAGKMAESALQTIKREFNWQHAAQKTLRIYRRCVGERL